MYQRTSNLPAAILFDLDGTLLDTAGDIIAAVNTALTENGYPPGSPDTLRPWVSQGGWKMISVTCDLSEDSEELHTLWHRFIEAYEENISQYTRFFDGLEEVLNALESLSVPWGIVTNKPEGLTVQLLKELDIYDRPACIIGADTAARHKPWPDPIILACERIGVEPNQTLMVGDSIVDAMAARNAGADAVAAAWGYIMPDDDPTTWDASAVLSHPSELWDWVGIKPDSDS